MSVLENINSIKTIVSFIALHQYFSIMPTTVVNQNSNNCIKHVSDSGRRSWPLGSLEKLQPELR